ncbi:TonB-dependent siderophore receptor [Halotalea alkalilenta]|uniref:TonB-dependent siderophore receptor n=1 Tax=Halotalea alkalilenta TaxID=376489 RepID=UPI000693D693|nr:TonB-dependent siderophore receptor [Halotalea alkalilenta]
MRDSRLGKGGALSGVALGLMVMHASPLVLAQQADDDTAGQSGSVVASPEGGSRLDTITVQGNRLYHMAPSEQTKGYAVDAATVGTKTPAALRDIPQSISVVTRDAIEDQNFHTLDEMARRTPGMRVLNNDNGRSSIYSRGYEYDEYSIDGLPAPMASIAGSVPQLGAFDRVEVMRGPSGLFNSTSEMGGIVNLVRKRPTPDFQGSFTGSYGSWNQRYLESDISGPLNASGSVRGRMVISNTDSDGFVDNNDNEANSFYGALDIDLDDATELSLAFLRQTYDIDVNNGVATDTSGNLLDYSRNTAFGADWNAFQSQSNDWIAELTHQFDNGGYGRVAARYSTRNADFNYAYGGSGVSASDTLTVTGLGAKVDERSLAIDASYSQPFEALGNVSEFVVGTDYKRFEQDYERSAARALYSNVSVDGINDVAYVDILGNGRNGASGYTYTNTRSSVEEYGLYSKITFRPIQRLALIAGGRVSSYDVHAYERTQGQGDTYSDDAKFTGYAGAVFDLDDHHSLYASYSQVFKPQTDLDDSGRLVEPREGDQYEAGIKGSYMNGRLNARASLFRLYDDNRVVASADVDDRNAAAGKTRIQGAELEVSGDITPQWGVIAGYTYMDTEIKEASSNDAVFLLMPKNTVNLWTQYAFQGGMLDKFSVGGGVTAASSFSSSQGIDAPGYATVDTMAAYDFTPNLRGQLNVNNVFDRKYYERVGSFGTFNMYGAPRNVVASLRYQF